MADFPSMAWMTEFQEKVNADAELSVIGDWFDTAFAVTVDDKSFVLHVDHGRISRIVEDPGLDVRCAFGMRAPGPVWGKFLARDPEPLFHDFFAMLMRVPEFRLEGDTMVAMQNARALHRMMNIMREMGGADA